MTEEKITDWLSAIWSVRNEVSNIQYLTVLFLWSIAILGVIKDELFKKLHVT